MRCPDCNKMVSYDTEVEPEEQDEPTVTEDGHLTASYRRVLTCADCGTELKESLFEFDLDLVFDPPLSAECEHEWEVDVSASPTEDVQRIDRRGKPITNPRYQARLYGVELSGSVKCTACNGSAEVSVSDTVQASSMDELV